MVQDVLAEQAKLARPVSAAKPVLQNREVYEHLFHLLQTEHRYLSQLAVAASSAEMESLAKTIVLSLYADQFAAKEEHMLLALIQRILKAEFERETGGISTFLRSETTLAKMLRLYTRRMAGRDYLKQVLLPLLDELLSDNTINHEINPLEVYMQLVLAEEARTNAPAQRSREVSVEQAAADPEVAKIVAENAQQLQRWCARVLNAVVASVDSIPYGIRFIAKQLAVMCKEHFHTTDRKQIGCIVGGFVFLRYITPALILQQPQLSQLPVSPIARRNLVLMGKVLQNLSNGVLFGDKEQYTTVLNPFLQQHTETMLQFFDALVAVEDLAEHYAADRFLYFARKKESVISVSINDVYRMHLALLKHIDRLAPSPDDPVRTLLSQLEPAPAVVQPDADVSLHLVPAFIQPPEAPVIAEDVRQQLLEQTLVALKQVEVAECKTDISDLVGMLEEAKANAEQFAAAEQIRVALELVRRVREQTPILLENLTEDLLQVLRRRHAMRESLGAFMNTLESAYSEVEAHGVFLARTLDAHVQYLQNVRLLAYNPPTIKVGKKKEKKREFQLKKVGPFRYSLKQLLQLGVLNAAWNVDGKGVEFVFTSSSPAVFDFVIEENRRPTEMAEVDMLQLLDYQKQGKQELLFSNYKLNVNPLIQLLNKCFMK